jgi:DNA-binding XRE family transcriptional regulator
MLPAPNVALQSARKRRGFTQMALAAAAGSSPTSIVFYEKYGARPRHLVRERIAAVLELSVDELWPAPASSVRSR